MFSDVPVGTIVAFAGNIDDTTPLEGVTPKQNSEMVTSLLARGWAYCNGQLVDKMQFNDLYKVIGGIYGEQGNAFRLPDYRGYFLRAVDNGAKRDTESREASVGGQSSGVGTSQKDQFQGHEHQYSGGQSDGPVPAESGADAVMIEVKDTTAITEKQGYGSPRYGKETRPINIAVNYLIKVRQIDPRSNVIF
ncbi:phage tail protein [Pleionea litopenaei]|uniref:Phage tail protein n=1 Tax=Pleionea litopenaei TaxID=3070815 RepID=A0AA51RSZ6_9GAMM|nr:phage tail protein [Pleionea sp. HL-JVS1]WMS87017.1 phage tail protein [Pleionea sp. HL-JVS1]